MQFIISQEGETLSDLVERLFCRASDAERKRIAGLVREANTGLNAKKEIPKATVVIIPPVEGIEASSDARTDRQIAASLIRGVREQIGDIGPILSQLVDRQEEGAQETLNLTKSPQVRKLAKGNEVIKDRLANVTEDVKERLKRSKTLRSVITKAENEFESDLNNLLEMLDPTSAPPPNTKTRKRRGK